jgi:hypothetical protein
VPLKPFTPIGYKLLLDHKEAITVLNKVLSKQTWKETLVMLNISTKVNIVNQQFAMECNFKIFNIELPTYS